MNEKTITYEFTIGKLAAHEVRVYLTRVAMNEYDFDWKEVPGWFSTTFIVKGDVEIVVRVYKDLMKWARENGLLDEAE